MFLHSEFYIYKENDNVLEFREKQSILYESCLIDISIFILFFWCAVQVIDLNITSFLFMSGIGVLALTHGVAPLLVQRKIVIDKNIEELSFMGGAKRFLLKSEKIRFSQIRHILIKETYESSRGGSEFPTGKDRIYLALEGLNDLKIEDSYGEIYTNEFVYKLSETIGCKVFSLRY